MNSSNHSSTQGNSHHSIHLIEPLEPAPSAIRRQLRLGRSAGQSEGSAEGMGCRQRHGEPRPQGQKPWKNHEPSKDFVLITTAGHTPINQDIDKQQIHTNTNKKEGSVSLVSYVWHAVEIFFSSASGLPHRYQIPGDHTVVTCRNLSNCGQEPPRQTKGLPTATVMALMAVHCNSILFPGIAMGECLQRWKPGSSNLHELYLGAGTQI